MCFFASELIVPATDAVPVRGSGRPFESVTEETTTRTRVGVIMVGDVAHVVVDVMHKVEVRGDHLGKLVVQIVLHMLRW